MDTAKVAVPIDVLVDVVRVASVTEDRSDLEQRSLLWTASMVDDWFDDDGNLPDFLRGCWVAEVASSWDDGERSYNERAAVSERFLVERPF